MNRHRYYSDQDFRAGYDARCLCEPFVGSMPKAWRDGWLEADADLDKGN